MFRTSESTAAIDAALAKAQSRIQAAVKDKTNPAFRSKYADLPAVWDACRDALTSNGISVTQWPLHSEDNRLHLVTRLACGGEWMMCEFSIPADKQNAHGYGSAITYAKRFSLAAAIGVVADEDDDGNAASANPVKAALSNVTTPPPKKDPLGPWKGPLGKSDLTKKLRQLTADINECEDESTLDGVLAGYQGVIEQLKVDIPLWWEGESGDGFTPLKQRIDARRALISNSPENYLRAGG
jgi:hypothetical protein